ncbi:MAG: hypothetical protein ACOC98_00520 [Thermodesulfobacteriota bacterium]
MSEKKIGSAIGAVISGLMLICQALETEEMINHAEYLWQIERAPNHSSGRRGLSLRSSPGRTLNSS